ncbi:glycosyltransferase [Bacillus salipaludis]|uniref:glycosyltransferase n=1 Tax=Bacillus salipaludis TaxID=2547811 RepID=UPI003D1F7D04
MKEVIFINKEKLIHTITIVTCLYFLYYIWWRLGTFNSQALAFSIVFFMAEIQGIANFLMFAFMTWRLKEEKPELPPHEISVDIFVPTYNEDLDILEATLIGCNNILYPHTTYVLDDGNRVAVRNLANQLGCEYIARTENTNAKAGNINHALTQTKGEIIAIFDADTVPQPDFLHKTLGYFVADELAVVQLPQEFYNVDSVQHIKDEVSWHEQQMFYRVIQPGKNHIGAPFWCGSPSLIRRSALEEIGGVATASITEDLHTTLKLNQRGWTVKYHHEVLAYGIAPQTLNAFTVQRLRWAQGAMQIFFSKDNPLFLKGLNWRQRLSHFASIWTYFDSYQKLIFLIVPSWFLLTGHLPMDVSPLSFLIHWLPYYFLGMAGNIVLGRGYFRYFDVERYNILKMFTFIRATLFAGLQKRLKFQVTPKRLDSSVKQKDLRSLTPLFVSLLFMILSLIAGSVTFAMNLSNLETLGALFWCLFNIVIYGLAVMTIIKRKYVRVDYRFPVELEGQVDCEENRTQTVQITDLSMKGVGFLLPESITLPKQVRLQLSTDTPIILEVEVAHVGMPVTGVNRVGCRLVRIPPHQRLSLVKYLYITVPRMANTNHEHEYMEQVAATKERHMA